MRKIHVKIDQLGNPTIEAEGFAGVSCEAATAPIEKALQGAGPQMTRELKSEYYASEETQQHEQQSW